MTKAKTAPEEKFEKQDFDMFEALAAIDRKDYGYYDRLSKEQQKKFPLHIMIQYLSAVKGSKDLQNYYVQSTEFYANKHLYNENVSKHPKLQWLMLCASSPGVGKQFHQYIPHIKERVSKLKDVAKVKDIKEYYKKIYSGVNDKQLSDMAESFVAEQERKVYLANKFPTLSLSDIEVLNKLITDEEIVNYEQESGNI